MRPAGLVPACQPITGSGPQVLWSFPCRLDLEDHCGWGESGGGNQDTQLRAPVSVTSCVHGAAPVSSALVSIYVIGDLRYPPT